MSDKFEGSIGLSSISVLLLGVGLLIVGSSFLFFKSQERVENAQNSSSQDVPVSATIPEPYQTPTPFVEMTVPFQREKNYVSNLSERQKLSENGNYTSYLTSYQSDGFKVYGLLTIPKGEMPVGGFPAIVFIHGYIPPTLYRTTQNYASYVDFLARRGFVVFKIDLRGHDKSEGIAGGGYYAADYVIDTLNARAALQSSGFVNKDLIGLWGHSMAGNIVMRSVVSKTDIKAAVIWAGAVYSYADMQEFGIDDNSYRPPVDNTERMKRREALRAAHGDFSVSSEFWKTVAPSNYVKDLNTKIQLHHAVDDSVVSIEYSRELANLLKDANKTHEFYTYQSGGHNLTGSSFTLAMTRTVEFFKTYLK